MNPTSDGGSSRRDMLHEPISEPEATPLDKLEGPARQFKDSLVQAVLPEAPTSTHIAVVVPLYNEEGQIEDVVDAMPGFVRTIIVVDDCSQDGSAARVEAAAENDQRIVLLRHEKNQGVGGAMVTGLKKALELGADIVVKMDGDGQMSPDNLPELLQPLLRGDADYTKGNRFRDFQALRQMPIVRRMGNMALSFMTKAAVGYWDLFDPCNGYVAIRAEVLKQLPLNAIRRSYFFETSMLAQLYLLGAVVRDVAMPARYGNEMSHLSVTRAMGEFPRRLGSCFLRRIVLKNFLYDFSMESIYILVSIPLLMLGVVYGGVNLLMFSFMKATAPTGTVVIPSMLIILGFQLVLSAIGEDLRSVPRDPLCRGPLPMATHQEPARGSSTSPAQIS